MCAKSLYKPKFHYADFHRNFPAGKVVDTNHESSGHKRWQIMKPCGVQGRAPGREVRGESLPP